MLKSYFERLKTRLKSLHYKILLPILVIAIALPLTVIVAQQRQNLEQHAANSNTRTRTLGYIVEFKDPPLSSKISKTLSTAQVQSEKENFYSKTFDQENNILNYLGKEAFGKGKSTFTRVGVLSEFHNVLNGIALDISESDANKLKSDPDIKAVYPNLEVKTNLMDSVPLIGADKVWQNTKDANGNPIDGRGINIGVIDTGVDYTHPDLGATNITERPLVDISGDRFKGYGDEDNSFTVKDGKLYYISGYHKVTIYNFADGTSKDLRLETPGYANAYSEIEQIATDGTYIAYVGGSFKQSLFVKNIKTGVVRKLDDITFIPKKWGKGNYYAEPEWLTVSNGRVIQERGVPPKANQVTNVFVYDVAKGTKKKLFTDSGKGYDFRASGDNIELAWGKCSKSCKMLLMNLKTGKSKILNPPEFWGATDFRGTKVFYTGLVSDESGVLNSLGAYLYDVQTGQVQTFKYTESQGNFKQQDLLEITSPAYRGFVGNGVLFDTQDGYNNIIAYDMQKGTTSRINLLYSNGWVAGEDKKVCFASGDNHIYCHDYDPNYNYNTPTNIFNTKVVGGYNFVGSNANPLDDNGHGTHIAEIVAGNGILKGVAPGANLISYKVLNSGGSGSFATIISAIDQAINTKFDSDPTNDISVISISIGAYCGSTYDQNCGPDDILSRAVDNASSVGIVSAIAAGNSGPNLATINSPGTARTAITVGSVSKSKVISYFSSRGPVVLSTREVVNKPDVLAPGENICSARALNYFSDRLCLDGKHVSLSGTSMATPHVAGLAALILQDHRDWNPAQVKSAIMQNADNLGYDINTQGAGMINALKIFGSVPTSTPSSTPTPAPQSPSPTPTLIPSPTPSPTS